MPESPERTAPGSISDYERKRDFAKTPEPPGAVVPEDASPPRASRAFVVHRHEARRLHYDLRIEVHGVLKSWAIPKGFSYDPTVRKLAVRTEDHPLSYTDFHGVIPRGEYGGGTMVVWDRGGCEITEGGEDGGAAGVRDGKLVVRLSGRKLRGAWHLVRTSRGENDWLIFKGRDRYVRDAGDRQPFFDLEGAVPWTGEPPPRRMRPGEETAPFSEEGWLFEPEFDGVPVFVERAEGAVRIRRAGDEPVEETDRGGANPPEGSGPGTPESEYPDFGDLGPAIPEAVEAAGRLRAETFLAFGVLAAPDPDGRPSADRLRARLDGDVSVGISLYLFDLLRYEEWDLRPAPLIERKGLLATLLTGSEVLLPGEHVAARGAGFHAACAAAGLPAAIARRAGGPWTDGRSADCRRIPTGAPKPSDGEHVLTGLARLRAAEATTRPIRFSNLDKIFWPDAGYTKGDLIRYYDEIAEHLIPHLHERPTHLLRYPDGIGGKAFYQKDLPDHVPDWIETESIESGGRGEAIRYLICNDAASVLYAANLGSIDLHPWLSVRTRRDLPDWAVFDLDPGGAPFPHVVRLAKSLGRILRGIGLRPLLKTSGASGLHVFVPLDPIYPYETVRGFCEAVSLFLAGEHPDIATVERSVARRGGRVYLDYMQNRRGQTIVPAYAVRPVPAASVSTPLDWDELDEDPDPSRFTIRTMPDRARRLGDLFAGAIHDRQALLPAIHRFGESYVGS